MNRATPEENERMQSAIAALEKLWPFLRHADDCAWSPDEETGAPMHIYCDCGLAEIIEEHRAALAATPEGTGKCPHLAVEFETVTPQQSTSAMTLPTPSFRRSRCRDCGASLGATPEPPR